ncbi:MAG: vWA domain-containing protein [Flavobacteriaceae bacterium]
MKSPHILACLYFAIFSMVSCGNADDDVNFDLNQSELGLGVPADDCLGFGENQLLLSIQDQFTTLPGKVSVFFKVTDTGGNPVPGLNAEQFKVYEQGRNDECFNTISASESQARISPKSQIFANNTLLVLDLSNSVLSNSLEELKSASISFVNNVMPEEQSTSFQMAIYWFDGENELHLLQELTPSSPDLVTAIEGISPGISNDPSTDLYGAVIKATDLSEDLLALNLENNIIGAASIVIFTDGTDQASRFSEQQALESVEGANRNISFYSIGLGAEIETEILTAIGKTFSAFAGNEAELEAVFNDISQKVSQQANSFYLFEYCTPKRDGSGENNLAIQVVDGDRQGAVQTQFDATEFSGGCE